MAAGAAIALTALMATPVTASASAQGKTLVQMATYRCLDSNGSGQVYTLPCNGGPYQRWATTGDGGLRNEATGRCLDSNGAGQVYTLPCNNGSYQKWTAVAHTLRNAATRNCLDARTAGGVYAPSCNGGNYQQWSPFG
ncbi:RICIN domain-containing protein [Streptomyces clavifer]|uniref:RICIN domain-containing protein n=1 Tax=Streptomyces clavifer TaxID=68188 RepID=UPI002E8041A4|nr:RICIN domain-containing protein [Streptomyces clavifer]WUC30888.1 RICIN domain-containing protein [Streptomyces clavifer]